MWLVSILFWVYNEKRTLLSERGRRDFIRVYSKRVSNKEMEEEIRESKFFINKVFPYQKDIWSSIISIGNSYDYRNLGICRDKVWIFNSCGVVMNKLTEQYKKEKDKYNPLYWIGVIGVVLCIVLNVIFTKIILMVIALLFLSLLVFLDIRGAILVKEYKNLEKYLIEYKRLKRINDKEGLKELEDTLSERQRNRLECMKNSKSEQ